ncbi:catalase family protein [Novipirellula caenicola]|uniref:Cytochrome c domain-containing protein n=1 Tax=Novipirellula caenicola TaxID=1536901 RepID=A0ABP9VSA0_9BACT
MRCLSIFTILAVAISTTLSAQTTYLDQGWSDEQRHEFYFTPQGSQLIPYQWFLALEQVDSDVPFRDAANLRRYGLLPSEPTERNPDGLPIGFVRDGVVATESTRVAEPSSTARSLAKAATRFEIKKAYLGVNFDKKLYPKERETWFGLTCAACHTHEIEYGGKTIRIDGGSMQADIESFLADLGKALQATHTDPEKLARFASRIGRAQPDMPEFKDEVKQIADAVNRLVERNRAKHPYGFARLDAFGAILNAVCETALNEPANRRESNAPVSFPSLWNTPEMGYVQWGASADFPEARNVGEVLGVFASFTVAPGEQPFDSTVRLKNLIKLEHELIKKLRAPDWPEAVFGKLDDDKVKLGQQLFAKNCQSCHSLRDPSGEFARNSVGKIPIRSNTLTEVQTDPQFLRNLAPTNLAKTGNFKQLFAGEAQIPRTQMLSVVVGGIMKQRAEAEQVDLREFLPKPQDPPNPNGAGYIARPLEGIWATAPYFHNGSVPNLYETLLPADQRSKLFWVGTRKFDPVKVGFVTEQSNIGSEFKVLDEDNHPIPGNSNAGHEGHGAGPEEGFTQTFENGEWRDFTDDERYALVEYMKSLSSNPNKDDTPDEIADWEAIPDGEAERIANIVNLTAQQMRVRYPEDKRMLRGVHPKDHGCVTAKFEVLSDMPPKYAVGVFQPGASYDAFIRFSNAAVRVESDSTRHESGTPVHGSRGMAIKLIGVEGEPLMPLHGGLTQDFVMVNQPAFAFANVEDYELLSQVLLDNNDSGAKFFVERLTNGTPEQKLRAQRTKVIVGRIAANEVNGDQGAFEPPPASPVDNSYFSAAPFLLGQRQVMKFRASPVARSQDPPNVDDPNYLRTALIKRLEKKDVIFDFAIQVREPSQIDIATDIENASTEWPDQYVTVARITIPKQDFDSPEQRVKCERLFFTPWHGIQEHRPLGGINRLRKAVYEASTRDRNLPKEPSSAR